MWVVVENSDLEVVNCQVLCRQNKKGDEGLQVAAATRPVYVQGHCVPHRKYPVYGVRSQKGGISMESDQSTKVVHL